MQNYASLALICFGLIKMIQLEIKLWNFQFQEYIELLNVRYFHNFRFISNVLNNSNMY